MISPAPFVMTDRTPASPLASGQRAKRTVRTDTHRQKLLLFSTRSHDISTLSLLLSLLLQRLIYRRHPQLPNLSKAPTPRQRVSSQVAISCTSLTLHPSVFCGAQIIRVVPTDSRRSSDFKVKYPSSDAYLICTVTAVTCNCCCPLTGTRRWINAGAIYFGLRGSKKEGRE